jgi:hypothetical protein
MVRHLVRHRSRIVARHAGSLAAGTIALSVVLGPAALAQTVPPRAAVREARAADGQTPRPDVRPGGGRILAGYRTNAARPAPGRTQALQAARAVWRSNRSGS